MITTTLPHQKTKVYISPKKGATKKKTSSKQASKSSQEQITTKTPHKTETKLTAKRNGHFNRTTGFSQKAKRNTPSNTTYHTYDHNSVANNKAQQADKPPPEPKINTKKKQRLQRNDPIFRLLLMASRYATCTCRRGYSTFPPPQGPSHEELGHLFSQAAHMRD